VDLDLRHFDPARAREQASPWIWFVALAPPVLWFAHLNISYLLVPVSCRVGHPWWLVAVSVPPLAMIAGAVVLSWRAWFNDDRPAVDRAAGAVGVLMGGLFGLVSLTILLANVVVDPCR
jgi:hypothetical protein